MEKTDHIDADQTQLLEAYDDGLAAGHAWFKRGKNREGWAMPEKSPFAKDSPKDRKWWSGFYHGSSDAENADELLH